MIIDANRVGIMIGIFIVCAILDITMHGPLCDEMQWICSGSWVDHSYRYPGPADSNRFGFWGK